MITVSWRKSRPKNIPIHVTCGMMPMGVSRIEASLFVPYQNVGR
jgi:hypothetical protein